MEPHFNLFNFKSIYENEIVKGIFDMHKREDLLNYEGEREHIKHRNNIKGKH